MSFALICTGTGLSICSLLADGQLIVPFQECQQSLLKSVELVQVARRQATTFILDANQSPLELLALWVSGRGISRCPLLHLHELRVDVALQANQAEAQPAVEVPQTVKLIKSERDLASDDRSH